MAIAAPSEKNPELSMAYVFGRGSIYSIDLGKSYLLIKRPPRPGTRCSTNKYIKHYIIYDTIRTYYTHL